MRDGASVGQPPDAQAIAHEIGRQLNLTLLHHCGDGGYGQVWLVLDSGGWRRALKVVNIAMNPAEVAKEVRGVREFCNRVNNEHCLPTIYSHGWYSPERGCTLGGEQTSGSAMLSEQRSYFWYQMQLADDAGGRDGYRADTLAHRLHQQGVMGVYELRPIMEQVLDCVETLHRHGLVHRDVKPGNILFMDGRATLGDIGLVEDASQVSLAGTPEYVPHDMLLQHGGALDGKMQDLYAVGCLLRDMLGLFRDQRPGKIYALPRGKVARRLNELMLRACSRNPVERYHDVATFRRDFLRCYGWREQFQRVVSAHPLLVSLGLSSAVGASVLLIGAWVLWSSHEELPLRQGRVSQKPPEQATAAAVVPEKGDRAVDWYAELARTRLYRDYVFGTSLLAQVQVSFRPAAGATWLCSGGKLRLLRGAQARGRCQQIVELTGPFPRSFEMVWLCGGTYGSVKEQVSLCRGGQAVGTLSLRIEDGSFYDGEEVVSSSSNAGGGFLGIHRLVCVNGTVIMTVDGLPVATRRLESGDTWETLRLTMVVEGAGEVYLSSLRVFEFVE